MIIDRHLCLEMIIIIIHYLVGKINIKIISDIKLVYIRVFKNYYVFTIFISSITSFIILYYVVIFDNSLYLSMIYLLY